MTPQDSEMLVEQLRSLRETPLRAGFAEQLQARLAEVSNGRGEAEIVPISRKPRRKLVFLLAAMSLPLAAAAATGAFRALSQPSPAEPPRSAAQSKRAAPGIERPVRPKGSASSVESVAKPDPAADESAPAESSKLVIQPIRQAPSRGGVSASGRTARPADVERSKGSSVDSDPAREVDRATSSTAAAEVNEKTPEGQGLERLGLRWAGSKAPGASSGKTPVRAGETSHALRQARPVAGQRSGQGASASERQLDRAERRGGTGRRQQGQSLRREQSQRGR